MTKIQWTDVVWNPVRGCSRVSPGCGGASGHGGCYAERRATRFAGPGQPYEGLVRRDAHGLPQWTGRVTLHQDKLAEPLRWRTPRRVFVNSMSDLFHEALPNEQIAAVFGVMAACPQHTFQVLTKRAERMREWFAWLDSDRPDSNGTPVCWYPFGVACQRYDIGVNEPMRQAIASHPRRTRVRSDAPLRWPLPNVWLGVSAEDQQRADERIPDLLACPAAVRFVSYEPALGPVDFTEHLRPFTERYPSASRGTTRGLHWLIVGGESGPGARECDVSWIASVVEQCKASGVACFVKQLSKHPIGGPVLRHSKGGDIREWTGSLAALAVREFPRAQ